MGSLASAKDCLDRLALVAGGGLHLRPLKHALRALTEVIQDGNHDNGIKAWIVCPGFVDTEMGYVVPGANPRNFLRVDEVVDMVRYLLHTGDNVKLGPEILIRTMRNPMSA